MEVREQPRLWTRAPGKEQMPWGWPCVRSVQCRTEPEDGEARPREPVVERCFTWAEYLRDLSGDLIGGQDPSPAALQRRDSQGQVRIEAAGRSWGLVGEKTPNTAGWLRGGRCHLGFLGNGKWLET